MSAARRFVRWFFDEMAGFSVPRFSAGSRLTYESGANDQLLLEDGSSFLLLEPQ